MEGNITTWRDGWDCLEKGITKMKRRLKGLPEPPFHPDEYRIIDKMVRKMCTPPHDYSQRLYEEYRKVFEEYMIKTVLRSLAEKHDDESLLRELRRKWQNNKEMVKVLSRFFHFLNRCFIADSALPTLNEVGLTCFRDLVYEVVKAKARDAVISLIDEEREGQQIDRTLLKDVIDIYVKIGMGQMECYEHDFEADMLQDSGAYYSRKASNWIVDESCNNYISKTDECLQRERDRVTHYLHISSEQKLVEKVQHELLVVYARHLLGDDKVEDLSLLYKYYHEILLDPVSTIFKQHVTAKGTALVQQAANGVGVQLRVPIRKITELCQKYKEYVNGCFLNHSLFHKVLKEAFEVICSKTDAGSPSAELLSMLCNDILKKGGSDKLGDEAIEESLRKGNRQAANLRKQGCPDYEKLHQLFAPSTATGNLQISSNTSPLNSVEERALEEELANANANASAPTHLDDDCYTPNFESFPQIVEDAEVEVEEVTQREEKHPVQDASGKGKKVSKKVDRVSEMTVTLKEYTTMTKERYSGKLGRSSGTFEQFAQSAVGGDPCSLGKAIELLNKYGDLNNKAYVKISKALQQKDNRVVFMGMPEHRRKTWIEDILNLEED